MPPQTVNGNDIFARKTFGWGKLEAKDDPPKEPDKKPVAPEPKPAPSQAKSTWRYNPPESKPMSIRKEPGGLKSSEMLQPGTVFTALEEKKGEDGILYLKLADGRGWVMEAAPGVGALCVREAQPPPSGLYVGASVCTVGLQSRPELNGKPAVLKGYDEGKGRWKVAFADGTGTKLLKEDNLELLVASEDVPSEPFKEAKDEDAARNAEVTPEALLIEECICGMRLLPHATFCSRCGTLRNDLVHLIIRKEPEPKVEAPAVPVETKEELYRRIEDMLTSGELEWEDW